jgi:hypothetical protein
MEESMGKQGRPPKSGGAIYKRSNSDLWQVRYKDRKGEIIRESAGTSDRQEAERFLRDRLDARDDGNLTALLTSKQLTFNQWADWFMERRSKPPFRSEGNHQQNTNALKFLRPAFGELALSEITSEAVEAYLGDRLQSGRRIHTKFGVQLRGRIKPATTHREFNLSHTLNVAVRARAARSQSLHGRRIPCFGQKINQEAALHDGNRTDKDRERSASLPEEYRGDHFRDGLPYRSLPEPSICSPAPGKERRDRT